MGLEAEVERAEDEVERKIIHEIVEHLPLVPDKARTAARWRASSYLFRAVMGCAAPAACAAA
jgi:hypothetical protein